MKKLLLIVFLLVSFFGTSASAQTNYTRMLSGVNYQTGTTYTFVPADVTRVVSFMSVSSVTATLPNGLNPGFGVGSIFSVNNLGVGTAVISCSGCTINGAGSLSLTTGEGADIYGDGLNFTAINGSGGGSALPAPGSAMLCFLSTGASVGDWNWANCPGGSAGNVFLAPSASQNLLQPAGTQFSANNIAGTRYIQLAPSTYNWSQTVTATLTGGVQATVTLNPCPLGAWGADTTSSIAINSTVEFDKLQGGGTCVPGSSGTIVFTPQGSFTNPSLGSASSGIQEGFNDALAQLNAGVQKSGGRILFQPSNPPTTNYYVINAPVVLNNTTDNIDVDWSGASFDCESLSSCFFVSVGPMTFHGNARVGTRFSAPDAAITATSCSSNVATITSTLHPPVNSVVNIRLTDNPLYWGSWQVASTGPTQFTFTYNSMHAISTAYGSSISCTSVPNVSTPGGVAMQHTFLEDYFGGGVTVKDVISESTSWTSGYLTSIFQIDGDQFAKIQDFNLTRGVLCDANYCGPAINVPSGTLGTPVVLLDHVSISMNCQGNGVDQFGGQGLTINNSSVIQSYSQYAVYAGPFRGSSGNTLTDSLYQEQGGCTDPFRIAEGFTGFAALASAGIEQFGGVAFVKNTVNGHAPGLNGNEPQFAVTGGTHYDYWAIICDGSNCSKPMLFGQASPPNSTAYAIGWPRYASQTSSTVTYQVLRTTEVSSGTPVAPTAGLAAAQALTSSPIAQCSTYFCTMNDSTSTTLQSYTPATAPALLPIVWNWPGSVVLGGGAQIYSDAGIPFNGGPIVPTTQNTPSVFVAMCDNTTPGINVFCPTTTSAVVNGGTEGYGGFILQNGVSPSIGLAPNLKGRINLWNPAAPLNTTHLITLNDSNPFKTLADANHRPANDANDAYIGLDQGVTSNQALAQLSLGAPAAISNYIGNVGDGTSWITRVTPNLFSVQGNQNLYGNLFVTGTAVGPAFPLQLTPFSDSFSGSGSLGGNWTMDCGTWTKASNQATAATFCGNSYTGAAYTGAGTVAANQFASVKLAGYGAPLNVLGPAVRVASGAESWDSCNASTAGASVIQEMVAGTGTNIGTPSSGPTINAGDILFLGVVGNQLTCYDNGVAIITATSSLSSGYPGMVQGNHAGFLSNFSGGAYAYTMNGNLTFPAFAGSGVQCVSVDNSGNLGVTGSPCASSGGGFTQTVASGTAALGTSSISSGTCASAVTVTATGVATTDTIQATFNGDPTGTTGFIPSTAGMLTILNYPTANNVNFKVCNNTLSSVTPGSVTLNWRVVR